MQETHLVSDEPRRALLAVDAGTQTFVQSTNKLEIQRRKYKDV